MSQNAPDEKTDPSPALRPIARLPASQVVDLLWENMPAYLFAKDEDFRIIAANKQFLSLYPEEDRNGVVGSTTVEKYDQAQRNLFLKQDRLAFENGFSETIETIDFPNGEHRTLLTKKLAYQGADQLSYILAISTDITDLRRTQSEAAQLGATLEVARNEIYILEPTSLRFLRANRGALDNLGYDEDELAVLSLADVLPYGSLERTREALEPLLDDAQTLAHLETEHLRQDGSRYPVEIHLHRSLFHDQEALLAIAVDTTEVRHYQRELEARAEELAEFAYRASHDFRSPVLSAQALLDLAAERIEAGEADEALEAVRKANTALDGAARLSRGVASVSRIDHPEAPLEEVDPASAIDDALAHIETLPERVPFRIERNERFAGTIQTEPDIFRTVLENFLLNAIAFGDPNASSPFIRISTDRKNDQTFVLECADNGLGIPEAYRPRLFSMFARLHPRVGTGSGLGLYLARRFAERMGGSVSHSAEDGLTIFRLELPICPASPSPKRPAAGTREEANG